MIPVVVAPPTDVARRRPPSRWATRAVGVLLVVAGVFGAAVWVAGFTPVGFERFDLADGPRSLRFDTAGEYVVYEQRVDGGLPQLTSIGVAGPDGGPVVVRPPAGATDGAVARSLPFFEAWELGRFSVTEPGTYTITSPRAGAGAAPSAATIAVAPRRTTSWLGGWAGFAVLGGAPLAMGIAVLWASRAGSEPPAQRRPETAGASPILRP